MEVVSSLAGLRSLSHNRLARDWRPRFIDSLWIPCESDPCKLPAFLRLEEIAVGPANMTARSGAGTATQNVLVAHELAIVFTKRAWRGPIAGTRSVAAARPFPTIAKHWVMAS